MSTQATSFLVVIQLLNFESNLLLLLAIYTYINMLNMTLYLKFVIESKNIEKIVNFS
jgi:hypothetical protein